MLPLQPQQQKIHVTCLVEHEGQILLLRGSQYTDTASSRTIGYFGLPRFTLGFGHNPAELIAKELETQFDQQVESLAVMGVHERMRDEQTQIIDLIYRARINKPAKEMIGKYVFASDSELEQFMLPEELAVLEKIMKYMNT